MLEIGNVRYVYEKRENKDWKDEGMDLFLFNITTHVAFLILITYPGIYFSSRAL